MAYSRGTSTNIIVGAAALFVTRDSLAVPADFNTVSGAYKFVASESYKTSLSDTYDDDWRNVGYTTNGLELQFQPDFGEVQVDQVLDVAKLYKSGMQVNLATAFAEATLENLLLALAYNEDQKTGTALTSSGLTLDLSAGDIGECPVERSIVAVGPGTGDCVDSPYVERVYVAYRALSIDNVTVSAKRDEASMFEVSFRLLPEDGGSYGKIVDRAWGAGTV